jgi:hypothetical protein
VSRLALLPKYPEVEHLFNAGVELWTSASQPDGWSIFGSGGTWNRDTDEADVYEGTASARLDKTTTAAMYLFQAPRQGLIPGMYYKLGIAKKSNSAGSLFANRFVNLTQNQCVNTAGTWVAGVGTQWGSLTTTVWKRMSVFFQVPTSFGAGDLYEYRVGHFGGPIVGGWFDAASLIGPYVRPVHLTALSALTYATVANKQIVAILTSPTGAEFDITRRIRLDGLGRITEGAEEEILQLTHGDMTLTLDDRDDLIKGLLDGAQASDRWEIVILSETGRAHGLKWDRLFAGVLDLPWSVQMNPREREITLQVFSYSKDLERTSATGIGRSVVGRTITIAAASKSATLNSTTDLFRGDLITARAGSTEEQFVVDRVDSGTVLRVKEAAKNTFTAADLALDTYFHREKTSAYLVGAVCDAAAVAGRSIALNRDLAPFPVAHPIAAHGLGIVTHPASLVQQTGKVVATFQVADETKRKETTGPTAAWTDGATSNVPQGDWRPYLITEPGTILASALGGNFDDGRMAWDHTGSHVYHNEHQNSGSPAFLNSIHLIRDGVDVGTWGGGAADPDDVDMAGFDFDPVNGRVWGSTTNTLGVRAVRYYIHGSGFSTFDAGRSGALRCCRPINKLVLLDDVTGKLRFYDLTTLALDREITPPDGTVLLWTLRAWDSFLAYLLTRADGTYVAIHDASTLEPLAVYRVSSKVASAGFNAGFLTVFTLADGRNVGIGYAGEEWLVLSRRLDGVVSYADFTGLSCAGALKDLAVASLAYFDADRYGTVSVTQRPTLADAPAALTITDPLERTSRPIWEFFRTACKVTGRDSLGVEFDVIQGDAGGSAKMLTIDAALISTPGMASAVALFYASYLNRVVRQEDLRIDEPEELVRVLDVVAFDDRRWLVTEVQTNTRDREQSLRLFEVP